MAIVGGMGGSRAAYRMVAGEYGATLRHFEGSGSGLEKRLRAADVIVVFTNMVSHDARNRALSAGSGAGIPVFQIHSCGVSSLRRCLESATNRSKGAIR
ncbi:MAG: DUF2325 domain-containing protein [Deltaproteobacteria bacterium]|nr:DUF2325 domain-containing protein [Deltaproteobacteria bacterium]